jgi:hypothetical protein
VLHKPASGLTPLLNGRIVSQLFFYEAFISAHPRTTHTFVSILWRLRGCSVLWQPALRRWQETTSQAFFSAKHKNAKMQKCLPQGVDEAGKRRKASMAS